jgi:hypothetical protein
LELGWNPLEPAGTWLELGWNVAGTELEPLEPSWDWLEPLELSW